MAVGGMDTLLHCVVCLFTSKCKLVPTSTDSVTEAHAHERLVQGRPLSIMQWVRTELGTYLARVQHSNHYSIKSHTFITTPRVNYATTDCRHTKTVQLFKFIVPFGNKKANSQHNHILHSSSYFRWQYNTEQQN